MIKTWLVHSPTFTSQIREIEEVSELFILYLNLSELKSIDKGLFLYYRLLHLILLAFNAFAVRSLSAVSGDHQSVFAKKENTNAVVLVASQVHRAEYIILCQ